jgi:hypothetical protein
VHTRLGSFLPPAPTPSLTTHSAPSLSPPPPQRLSLYKNKNWGPESHPRISCETLTIYIFMMIEMPIIAEPWRRTPWVFLSCPNFCFSRDPHNWFDFLTLEKKLEGKDGFWLMKEKLNLQKWDRCSQQSPWEIPSLESTSTKPRMEHRGITQVAAHLCVGPLSHYPSFTLHVQLYGFGPKQLTHKQVSEERTKFLWAERESKTQAQELHTFRVNPYFGVWVLWTRRGSKHQTPLWGAGRLPSEFDPLVWGFFHENQRALTLTFNCRHEETF